MALSFGGIGEGISFSSCARKCVIAAEAVSAPMIETEGISAAMKARSGRKVRCHQ